MARENTILALVCNYLKSISFSLLYLFLSSCFTVHCCIYSFQFQAPQTTMMRSQGFMECNTSYSVPLKYWDTYKQSEPICSQVESGVPKPLVWRGVYSISAGSTVQTMPSAHGKRLLTPYHAPRRAAVLGQSILKYILETPQ